MMVKSVLEIFYFKILLKPLQNKKVQKNLGCPKKSSLFPYKRTAFFSGTPNFFGPTYFEAALARPIQLFWTDFLYWAAVTLKGLVELRNKKKSRTLFTIIFN